jgi:hypothetical protein
MLQLGHKAMSYQAACQCSFIPMVLDHSSVHLLELGPDATAGQKLAWAHGLLPIYLLSNTFHLSLPAQNDTTPPKVHY